jgi:hypothetical protein
MGRKQGTGHPDPNKDRSVHLKARGVKKLTLSELTRLLPSASELHNYYTHIQNESDRGAATMAAALVERALEDQIRGRLHDPGDGTADLWFVGTNAPFRTFSAKIALGRALGVYDDSVERLLVCVKNIRNTFAHGMVPLDFSNAALAEECAKLIPKDEDPAPHNLNARNNFAYGCLALARILGMKAVATEIDGVPTTPQGAAE